MHGAPPTQPFQISWRKNQPEDDPSRPAGPRNIFRSPDPATEAFRADDLIPVSGEISERTRQRVHALMTKLEARVSRPTVWESPLTAETADDREAITRLGLQLPGPDVVDRTPTWRPNDNPFVPSGFTYLLQLAAHDLVDSVRFATMELAPPSTDNQTPHFVMSPLLANARLRPLMLDTVYGAGPFEQPLPYDTQGSSATEPRTLLRTFALNKPKPGESVPADTKLRFCPYADIMRGFQPAPPLTPDSPPAISVYQQPRGDINADRTEAFVADPRNDDHSIISQLLVMFHLLHNTVISALPVPTGPLKEDNANRRFLCARFVTALIYRHILKQDVLSRVLDPDVYEAYMTNTRRRLPLDTSPGIPMEFTVGAFRFGHAMVREGYRTNALMPGFKPFSKARSLSAARGGAHNGLPDFEWAIDWALFFGPNANVNLTNRISPHYASGLVVEPPKGQTISERLDNGEDTEAIALADAGLGARDFLSAAYAGMWSVPALFSVINRRLDDEGLSSIKLAPYDDWKESLRVWLKDYKDGRRRPRHMTDEEIDRIAKDPPLSFFVMFEAAHETNSEGRPRKAQQSEDGVPVIPGRGGRHLGRFGSILVADTIFGALHTQYFGFDEFSPRSLKQGIQGICQATIGDAAALDEIFVDGEADRPLQTMQHLLALLQSRGVFKEPA